MILFVPAALRYNIGTDYPAYVQIFDAAARNRPTHGEIGWLLLNKAVYWLGGGAQVMFAVVAFLTLFPVFCSVRRKELYVIIPAYIMLYYLSSYNITRQVLSASLIFYALGQYDKRKYVKAVAFTLIAASFHISALLFFGYYFLAALLRIKRPAALVWLVVIYVLFNVLNVHLLVLKLSELTVYAQYLKTGYVRQTTFRTGIGVLMYMLMACAALVGIKGKTREASNRRVGVLLLFCSIFVGLKIFILNRLRDIFFVTLLPAMQNINQKSRYRWIVIIAFVLFAGASFCATLLAGSGEVTPYRSVLGK